MAEQLSTNGQTASIPLSASTDRHETIRRAMRQISELETKRKSIGAEIRAVKNQLVKGDLDFKIADWQLLQRLYDSEQEQRDETMDCLREGFAALGVGGQLNWVSTIEAATKEKDVGPADNGSADTKPDNGSAEVANFNQGRQAGLRGETGKNNPWPEGVRAHETWERGWVAGQSEIASGLAENGSVASEPDEVGAAPTKRGPGRPRRSKAAADLLN